MPINLFNKTITTIFFDLDGTLINHSTPRILANSAVVEFLKTKSNKSYLEIWNNMESTYESIRQNWFTKLLDSLGIILDAKQKQETIDLMISLYYASFDKGCVAYPDALILLKYLKDKVQLGVLSDTDSYSSIQKLKHGGLIDYFTQDMIVTYDLVGAKKPNPAIFEFALNKSKSLPQETIYIGDIPSKDVLGANNMAISSIRLKRDTFANKLAKENEIATLDLDNYYELIDLIAKNN